MGSEMLDSLDKDPFLSSFGGFGERDDFIDEYIKSLSIRDVHSEADLSLSLSSLTFQRSKDSEEKLLSEKNSQNSCAGSFYRKNHGELGPNARICSQCLNFQVPMANAYICSLKNSPFAYRRRTVALKNSDVIDYRLFIANAELAGKISHVQGIKTRPSDFGIVFFRNAVEGNMVYEENRQVLWKLEQCFRSSESGEDSDLAIRFSRCPQCHRKVYPCELLDCCTKPSCVRKGQTSRKRSKSTKRADLNSKFRSAKQSEAIQTEAAEFNLESPLSSVSSIDTTPDTRKPSSRAKRRRHWKIFPGSCELHGDFVSASRAVIKSPEELCWESTNVIFGGVKLERNVDFICGISEIVVLKVPLPEIEQASPEVNEVSIDNTKPRRIAPVQVEISDGKGTCGTVEFQFVFS